ncbi:MAG TPA: hypothetical protein VH740_20160 [Vicinamibacterales bacterium]|jgi:hypothetical protein
MAPDSRDRNDLDIVGHALSELPSPRAPRTLLPRVMAAASAKEVGRARPAATTSFVWPSAWQAASLAALVVLVAGLAWIWPSARGFLESPSAGPIGTIWTNLVVVVRSTAAAASVVSVVWESLVRPIVPYVFVWIVLMSAACAGFGAALGRVALGGASHS